LAERKERLAPASFEVGERGTSKFQQSTNKYSLRRRIQMIAKQFARFFLLALMCCSLAAVAQEAPAVNVTGGGTKGKIPIWTGAHKIGNSNISQDAGGNENFGAGINAAGVISGASDVDAAGSVNATGVVVGDVYVYGVGAVYGALLDSLGGNTFSGEGFFSTGVGSGTYNTTNDNGSGSYPVGGQTFSTAGTSFEFAFFDSNGSPVFYGDSVGDTVAVGSKSAAVPLKNGQMVKIFSQESPQVWIEDFGAGKLVGGVATIKLDSKFGQTVNTRVDYHVFLTPNGDCKGLYVAQKSHNSFEVRELGGGQSNVSFDYRIAALRLGYEKVRMPAAHMPTVQKIPHHAPPAPVR
jgi:hypothetical protein